MKHREIIFGLMFIFLGIIIFSPEALARRRPSVSSGTEEEAPTVQKQEVKETIQPQSSEELSGEDLKEYLIDEKTLSIKEKEPTKTKASEEKATSDEDTGFSAWTPTNAMLRSLILPGWGQFFNEQYTKGYIFAGTEVILLSTTLIFYNQADSTYNDYKNGSASYDDYSKKVDNTNMVLGIFAAVWIYNVIDAYVNAFGPDEESLLRKDGFTIAVNNNQGLSVLYTRKF